MKKLNFLLLFVMLIASSQVFSQLIYTDDFEGYTAGTGIAEQDTTATWTTWSESPGGTEDPLVTDEAAHNGTHSIVIQGTNDGVLLLNDLTENRYRVEFYLMVPNGTVGYYNILQDFAGSGSTWGMQIYFNNGVGTIDGDGESAASFDFTHGEWMKIQHFVDLDNDWIDFYINDSLVHAYQWSAGTFGSSNMNKLDAFNFYAWNNSGASTPKFFMDDYLIEQVAVPNPPENLEAIVNGANIDLSWNAPTEGSPVSYSIIKNGEEIAVVDDTTTTYTDEALYPRTYSYELKAFYGESVGYSSSVGPVEATIPGGVTRNFTLMEIFTGTWCSNCPAIAVAAEDIGESEENIAILEYHNGDAYVIPGATTRENYYSVAGFPTTNLDGELLIYGGGAASLAPNMLTTMENQQAINIDIPSVATLETEVTYIDSVNFDIDITTEETYDWYGDNLALHVVLTESGIAESWQGLNDLHYVVRKMLPDGNGSAFNFNTETSHNFNFQLELDESWIKDECELVVFIQDNDTKDIIQATKIAMDTIVAPVGIQNTETIKASVHPNPLKDQLIISANDAIHMVEIMNLAGQTILTQNFNQSSVRVNTTDIMDGVYIVKIKTTNGLVTRKVIK